MWQEEKLLQELQNRVQEGYRLQNKEELKALVKGIKGLQDTINEGEEEIKSLKREIEESRQGVNDQERQLDLLSEQIEKNKERLYESQGKSLKELLSLQQSVFNMEQDRDKGETCYLEREKSTEDLIDEYKKKRSIIKELKLQYNDEVREYRRAKEQGELKTVENKIKQEEIKEEMKPETLRVFEESLKRFPLNPVAVLKNGSCMGCHIGISDTLARTVKEGKTLCHCDNCGRIIVS